MHLLLDVWREACRHIEIDESVDRIAGLVAQRLPAVALAVRRIDLEHQRLETVTVGVCRPSATPAPRHTRTELPQSVMRALIAWASGGEVLRGRPASGDPLIDAVTPPGVNQPVVAGPLVGEGGPTGVLVAIGDRGREFSPEDAALLRSLLEPFSVALANHDRLHELARLREALEADKRALLSRLDRQDVMDSIVGQDAGLRAVMERVEQVAPTDAPVLLLGETGTGKEVVARAIHARSARAHAPVVRVNCGALPAGLLDSELFGHERGSFTGAVSARKGWFERADGGTLFLDEVAELPLDAQVRLLRIVQDGTFERVGGQKPITVDVRIVAATHRDLPAMVASGRFREDLWYRIGVFPIRLPPLRERREDIPPLAAHFAWRAGVRLAGQPLTLTPDDVEQLVRYDWPGNVRELAAVVERAAILGDGRALRLAAALGAAEPTPRPRAQAAAPVPTRHTPLPTGGEALTSSAPSLAPGDTDVGALDSAMRQHIERALAASLGRIEGPFGAAARLRINPHTLRSRMRRLGIDWRAYRQR